MGVSLLLVSEGQAVGELKGLISSLLRTSVGKINNQKEEKTPILSVQYLSTLKE